MAAGSKELRALNIDPGIASSPSRVLVTGSAGFIGRHLVRRLVAEGRTVLGLDRESCERGRDGASHVSCDILHRDELERVLVEFRPWAVVHLAARTDLNEKRDLRGYAANSEGVANLVAAIGKSGTVQRCIFTSSQAVCAASHPPRDEYDYRPNTLYGQSKVQTEQVVRQKEGGGAPWCLVRPTTVWGPGMSPHYQRFFRMIARGSYFHVGTRPLYKSYGFVGNVVHQYMRLLSVPVSEIHGKTLYLADYEPISLRDWSTAFQRALGARDIPTYPEVLARVMAWGGDWINAIGFRRFPFNTFRLQNILTEYCYDLRETERICGPLPYTVERGIAETAAWLKATKIAAQAEVSRLANADRGSEEPA